MTDRMWNIRSMPEDTRRRAVEMATYQGLTVAKYLVRLIELDYKRQEGFRELTRKARERAAKISERTPLPN